MEELQDAIEDAQYVSAIASVEDGPRPVLPWDIPEKEDLIKWKEDVVKNHGESLEKSERRKKKAVESGSTRKLALFKQEAKITIPFEFEWTLDHALGFFLFSAYLKESVGEHVEINFMEEVVRWKNTRGRFRAEKTSFIVNKYLEDLPEGLVREYKPAVITPPPPGSDVGSADSGAGGEEGEGGMKNESGGAGGEKATDIAASAHSKSSSAPPSANGKSDDQLGGTTSSSVDPSKNAAPLPPKSQINEYDLRRPPTSLSHEEVEEIRGHSSDPTKNVIGVGGKVLETIMSRVDKLQKSPGYNSLPEVNEHTEENNGLSPFPSPPSSTSEGGDGSLEKSKKRSIRNLSMISNELPQHLFDEAELIVAENLRERYWVGFQSSSYHAKLLNFLWFQDRTVVEEDFFVMRVLGRGGFGLVTGELMFGYRGLVSFSLFPLLSNSSQMFMLCSLPLASSL